MDVEGCYYISVWGTAFGWTQMVPVFVTLVSFAITAATGEAFYALFGLYLWIPQWFVWVFQFYLQWARPNPICQTYHTWAFPSTESMYIGAILGAFFAFAYHWSHRVTHSWMTFFWFYLLGIVPPFILIYIQYNVWWEVTISWVFGFATGVAFSIIMRIFIRPAMPYLELHSMFWIFGYKDSIMRKKPHNVRDEIRISLAKMS